MSEAGGREESAAVRREAEVRAAAYARALGDMLEPGLANTSQNALAKATHVAPSTVSRYLSGERIAPAEFVQAAVAFLADRGEEVAPEVVEELNVLRRAAQRSSPRPDTRALYWMEEARRATDARARSEEAHRATAGELEEVAVRLGALENELDQALAGRAAAEEERDANRAALAVQQEQLAHAQRYARQIEGELTAHQAEVHLLRREVTVLRHQVERLRDEAPPTVGGETVPGMATQVTAPVAAGAVHTEPGEAVPFAPPGPASARSPGGGRAPSRVLPAVPRTDFRRTVLSVVLIVLACGLQVASFQQAGLDRADRVPGEWLLLLMISPLAAVLGTLWVHHRILPTPLVVGGGSVQGWTITSVGDRQNPRELRIKPQHPRKPQKGHPSAPTGGSVRLDVPWRGSGRKHPLPDDVRPQYLTAAFGGFLRLRGRVPEDVHVRWQLRTAARGRLLAEGTLSKNRSSTDLRNQILLPHTPGKTPLLTGCHLTWQAYRTPKPGTAYPLVWPEDLHLTWASPGLHGPAKKLTRATQQ
ncbi:helix-turn-helix domain-containing protein [Streptomyces cremeus]|uniref:Helix-turn-helix domain-containing protein n=1 Tax=Streptomyces cremeus TaxID=66881 RepID=A0ABV5PE72_STRCM